LIKPHIICPVYSFIKTIRNQQKIITMTTKQFIKTTLLCGMIFLAASINNRADAQRRLIRDRREDVRDRREDRRDRREDVRDRREDIRDARHDGGVLDRLEDVRDRREDVRDRREDVRDRREDIRDRRHPRPHRRF
jgi:hypothetical protein